MADVDMQIRHPFGAGFILVHVLSLIMISHLLGQTVLFYEVYPMKSEWLPSASSRLRIGVTPMILSSKMRLPLQCQPQN